jgi:two-component system chemotaxis response regulator CheY
MPAKILIVEDNADSRDCLALLLKEKGYKVYTAEDGEQGIKLVEADCPDIIVTDINMPHMNGIEMVRLLRDRPDCSKLPIIVVSAHGSGSLKDAMSAGADDTMRKPIDFVLLAEAIERLLE